MSDAILALPQLPIINPRLILRDFVREDIPAIQQIVSDPAFTGYSRFRPENVQEDVIAYIEEAISFQKPVGKIRDVFKLAICHKDDASVAIGCCVFDGWHQILDDQLGYFIHPLYQGKGYAIEAMRFLLKAYFICYPLRNTGAIVHPENYASQKLLEKLGLFYIGSTTISVFGREEPRLQYSGGRNNIALAMETYPI